MATFEQYQNHLRGLGAETANIRREMAMSASGSPALEAEYNRVITEIDATVTAIRAEHPDKCWHDDDYEYRLLKAQWALDRSEMKRLAAMGERRLLTAIEALEERVIA